MKYRIILSLLPVLMSAGSWGEPAPGPVVERSAPAPALKPLLPEASDRGETGVVDWTRRRENLKSRWLDTLGRPPENRPPVKMEVLETETLPEFTRQRIRYPVEEGVFTEAYLLTPRNPPGRLPAVVVFHQTVNSHIRQAAGVDFSEPELMQGAQLAARGYVVLCPRCYIFDGDADFEGQATAVKTRNPGWTGMTRMLSDAFRAADCLVSLSRVDPDRIGCIGHSLGAKEALYAAAFDERYRAAVFNEGGIGLEFSNWDAPWYLGPGIRKPGLELEHHQLLALVAPRAFLLMAGDSADDDRSRTFVEAAWPVFRLLGVPDHVQWFNHRTGHRYPPAAREVAEAFLDLHLKNPAKPPEKTIRP